MNYSKTKNRLIALALIGTIITSTFMPYLGIARNSKDVFAVEKSDSIKVQNQAEATKNKIEGDGQKSKSNSGSHQLYSFIYHLIFKFLKTNPLSRPK